MQPLHKVSLTQNSWVQRPYNVITDLIGFRRPGIDDRPVRFDAQDPWLNDAMLKLVIIGLPLLWSDINCSQPFLAQIVPQHVSRIRHTLYNTYHQYHNWTFFELDKRFFSYSLKKKRS